MYLFPSRVGSCNAGRRDRIFSLQSPSFSWWNGTVARFVFCWLFCDHSVIDTDEEAKRPESSRGISEV